MCDRHRGCWGKRSRRGRQVPRERAGLARPSRSIRSRGPRGGVHKRSGAGAPFWPSLFPHPSSALVTKIEFGMLPVHRHREARRRNAEVHAVGAAWGPAGHWPRARPTGQSGGRGGWRLDEALRECVGVSLSYQPEGRVSPTWTRGHPLVLTGHLSSPEGAAQACPSQSSASGRAGHGQPGARDT